MEQSGKTFQQCLDEAVKGIGNGISDIEMYKRAVKFYFPTADIHFRMTIDLCGDIPGVSEHTSLSVSLDKLLDF